MAASCRSRPDPRSRRCRESEAGLSVWATPPVKRGHIASSRTCLRHDRSVRIGTWNLDSRGHAGMSEVLAGLDADVLLLTETPASLNIPGYNITFSADVMARGQSYAAVAARRPLTPVLAPHGASAAARAGSCLYVSTVLPWGRASGPPWRGASFPARTSAALDDLEPFLRTAGEVVWGGDWNHTLEGALSGSTRIGRQRLENLTRDLGLHVPTRHLPRGRYEMSSIDHVAVADPAAQALHVPVARRLSDRDAYVVVTTRTPRGRTAPASYVTGHRIVELPAAAALHPHLAQ